MGPTCHPLCSLVATENSAIVGDGEGDARPKPGTGSRALVSVGMLHRPLGNAYRPPKNVGKNLQKLKSPPAMTTLMLCSAAQWGIKISPFFSFYCTIEHRMDLRDRPRCHLLPTRAHWRRLLVRRSPPPSPPITDLLLHRTVTCLPFFSHAMHKS